MAETPKMKMDVDVSVHITEFAATAIEFHESFMTFVSAGFTREEALTIMLEMMKAFRGNQ